MPLTLVLGPANSAKAGEVLAAYAAAARRDALLVVPTSADAAHYDRELSGVGIALGRALTFAGLIDEIARRARFEAPRLTPLQRDQLISRTVASLPLPALGTSARAAGFAPAAARLIAELGRARVAPPRFAAALRAWAGTDPGRGRYATDVASIPLRYAAALERSGRLDADGFGWAALDALRANPSRWGATPVYVYGFDDLTRIELDAIETLAGVADSRVTVSLTYEPGRPALAARGPVVVELRGLAGSVRQLESRDDHYEAGARAALHHLERNLFEAGAERIDPGDAVALLEAGGERAEAELIAAEVLGALRAGVPPGEIVVVCRSLARSGALLERTLASYGVSAGSERRIPLAHTALGRGLLALCRCAFADADARELLVYLRTPGACEESEPVDQLAVAIRRRGIRSAAAALAAFPADLPELEALRRAADPVAELAGQARRLLAAAHGRSAAILSPDEELDARAARAVLEALGELAALPEPATPEELIALLASLEVPSAHTAAGAVDVLVAEPLAIRGRRFRLVLVCGLCESEFPAPAAADPFLGDEQRRELALASGLALPIDDDPLARERYLFYACVSRASERLVLSYRSSDEDGNLVLPSPFLLDVAELFEPVWFDRRRRRLLADVVWPPAEAPTERERALAAAEAAAGDADPGGPPATRVLGERALGHVRHRDVVSGGALELFAACPVKWLVERQLDPAELDPDSDALVRGDFMHGVLERVLAGLGGPVNERTLPEAERRLAELTTDVPADLAPGQPPAVRRALLEGIAADLGRYLRHEAQEGSDWVPQALELGFGFESEEEGDVPGLVLGDGDDSVRVRGVIDRIDVEPGGRRAIVRDYKSGANRLERAGARWLDGAQLQVGLYMLAVRRLLALEPVAGFYQPLTGRELRPRGAFLDGSNVSRSAYATDAFDPAALAELLDEIERAAIELAMTLRRGELTPAPGTCSRDGCRHPGICWAVR
jgi:ATP-dependent helicase/DNAse subunit B